MLKFIVRSKHRDANKYQELFDKELEGNDSNGQYSVFITDDIMTKDDVKDKPDTSFFIHTAKKENTDAKKRKLVKAIIADLAGE